VHAPALPTATSHATRYEVTPSIGTAAVLCTTTTLAALRISKMPPTLIETRKIWVVPARPRKMHTCPAMAAAVIVARP
jgi:hypothetical protein